MTPGVLEALLQPRQMEALLHAARSSSSFHPREDLRPASTGKSHARKFVPAALVRETGISNEWIENLINNVDLVD